ncbi:MAG: glutathione S-transferase N-terminal domain-containing protein [Candidatus Taylorbacteria bacterium]|nr:glutathione S-transferase N-terminal domain-containing protein [Candidatus Taylorbacteria bacterium]
MKKVEIYTTPTCVYCKAAKEFFKEHNITYAEHDVAADFERRSEMFERSGQMGVPVISIDGQILIGYDKNALAKAFGVYK